jgi:hypothetical protein
MWINATTNLEDFWQLACSFCPCWSAGWDNVTKIPTIFTNRHNIQQFHVLPTQCIDVFCTDLRTSSGYFPIQHQLTGFYNRDGVCLLRRTDWIFKYNLGQSWFTLRQNKHYSKNKHPEKHSFCNGGAAHNNTSDTIQSVQYHSSTTWDPTGNLQLIIHLLSAASSQADFEHRHVNGCTCKAYVSTRTW